MKKRTCKVCSKEPLKKAGAGRGRFPSYCGPDHKIEGRRAYRKNWMRRKRHSKKVLGMSLDSFNETDNQQ